MLILFSGGVPPQTYKKQKVQNVIGAEKTEIDEGMQVFTPSFASYH